MNYRLFYPEIKSPTRNLWIASFVVVLIGATFGYALSCILGGPASDENFHANQIWHYYNGGNEFSDAITVPPTYHYVMALIVRQFGFYSDYLLRFINLIVSLCALPVFYSIAARYYPSAAGIRMLQLFFAPLIFPYFFLVYTDIWTLLAIAVTISYTLNRSYLLAGLASIIALTLRQDSVIWIGLAYLLISFEGVTFTKPLPYRLFFYNAFVRGLPIVAIFILFIAFLIYNGGVALGDKDFHDMGSFNISNVYVFLVCAWALFLPLNLYNLSKIIALLKQRKILLLLFTGFFLYMGTISNPHPYNNTLLTFFLHNGLIHIMATSIIGKILFFFPIAWMVMSLAVTEFPDKRFYWLFLIIPIAAIMHPMIEPRYYIPAFVFINLWRPSLPNAYEIATLCGYIVIATIVMYGTVTGMFFL